MILLKDQLYAFQSLEYEPLRFLRWVIKNLLKLNLEKKKKLIYTNKVKYLAISSTAIPVLLLVLPLAFRTVAAGLLPVYSLIIVATYIFFPWVYLIISAFLHFQKVLLGWNPCL